MQELKQQLKNKSIQELKIRVEDHSDLVEPNDDESPRTKTSKDPEEDNPNEPDELDEAEEDSSNTENKPIPLDISKSNNSVSIKASQDQIAGNKSKRPSITSAKCRLARSQSSYAYRKS